MDSNGYEMSEYNREQDDSIPYTAINRFKDELFDWAQNIAVILTVVVLMFIFVFRIIGVDGSSMEPTLHDKDWMITTNLFYEPDYGDIVVLTKKAFMDKPIVKRIIATEGQVIDIDFNNGIVSIDGKELVEPYIAEKTHRSFDFSFPATVPKDCVFVMGDNRNESADSRSDIVGMVDTRQILGKVLFVLIPGNNVDGSRSWNNFGSVYRKVVT